MIEAPAIVETAAQLAAVIHLRIPRSKIEAEIPPAINELTGALGERDELQNELDGRGLTVTPTGWERYLSGPESSPDPRAWRTELNMRLEEG